MFLRIVLYVFIVVAVLFIGFLAIIIVSFAGSASFYVPLIVISGISLLTLILLHLFHHVKSKNMKIAWVTFLSLVMLSCAVHEGINAYDRSIPRVREGSVDLDTYAPYAQDTKAVLLGEPSTLKLDTDLPLLDGATALYPLYSAFAQAVYPEKKYNLYGSEVVCRGTIRSYQSLIDREVDMIFVAPPSKEQSDIAEEAGVTFRYTPIGKEAFVFFVNARNPVENLTVEQLQAIYSGEITNWKVVGGNDESIRAFQRNKNSGSQTAFLRFMKGKTIMDPLKEDIVSGMGGIISQTADYANYRNAIGFSFRFYANEMVNNQDVRLLKINGVYPDSETIGNGEYPLSSEFFAITLADNDKPNVLKLLDWIVSEQGQYLVKKTGYAPIK
jgi:phosphate transport system substrate-binding protein